jgi:hypothetical protein
MHNSSIHSHKYDISTLKIIEIDLTAQLDN